MAQFLRDLLLNGYNGVKPIETIQKGNNLGQQIKDVASAELSKTGPRVLFYKQLPTLYGTDLIRISTKGSVDPSRTLAVKGSRYNDGSGKKPVGGGFGRFLGNLLGGPANRPSDTIFVKEGVDGNKPISVNGQPIGGDWNGLKYAVEPETEYLVSQEPAGTNALTGLLKGNPSDIVRNTAGAAMGAGKQLIGNLATKALTSKRKKAIGDLKEKLKESKKLNTIGREYNSYENPGSKYIKNEDKLLSFSELINVQELGLKDRDYLIDNNVLSERMYEYSQLQSLIEKNTNNTVQFIRIKKINNKAKNSLLFPAAISDIRDDMTPEWNSFKYVGSPFNVYRYTGVERKIGFDFQVYWIGNGQQIVMRDKLNLLRELVYPDSRLQTITLKDNNYSPLVFSPNLIELSVGDLYKNLKGFVSNLSISVPNEATWAHSNPNFLKENSDIVYPTYVNVSFEMTITENHIINSDDTITYRFDEVDELEGNPSLPTQPVSSIPRGAADYGYDNVGVKSESQKAREINKMADFANRGLTNSIYGKGGTIRWDADMKNWGK
jgi:hypothetical protein